MKTVQRVRQAYTLPDGEDWLDQRQVPIFPLVHGPKAFVDAYNNRKAT